MKANFTKIANNILEGLCNFHLSGEEARIIYVIFRKTYGFNKKEDAIALSQFVDLTGMDKRNVGRTLKKLEDRNVIFIKRGHINVYKFNKYPHEWRGVSR